MARLRFDLQSHSTHSDASLAAAEVGGLACGWAAGQQIGRPHLAEGALRSPANASRLREEGIDEIGSFIGAYLTEGRQAFRLRETPTVAEAIDAIHEAGGVAVWAHPFW